MFSCILDLPQLHVLYFFFFFVSIFSDLFVFGTRYDVVFFCVEVEQIPCCGHMCVFPN